MRIVIGEEQKRSGEMTAEEDEEEEDCVTAMTASAATLATLPRMASIPGLVTGVLPRLPRVSDRTVSSGKLSNISLGLVRIPSLALSSASI